MVKNAFITNSAEETEKIGFELVNNFENKNIICLYGELGSGKTTFVKGMAKGLGIKKQITSPTFLIVKSYKIGDKRKKKSEKDFYHIDLYRTESKKDFEGLGLEEILKNPGNIVVIEWAEKLGNALPDKRIDIQLEYIEDRKRKININNFQ